MTRAWFIASCLVAFFVGAVVGAWDFQGYLGDVCLEEGSVTLHHVEAFCKTE